MLDSLNRYEFLKVRAVQLRTDLQNSQTDRLGLKILLVRSNIRVDSSQRANVPMAKKVVQLEGKLKSSRTENWVWRGVGLLALLQLTGQLISVFK